MAVIRGEGQGLRGDARPLLKWAGGKRQLLPALRSFYPADFKRYWEPFLGSAAVFFDLQSRGALDHRGATLNDSNPDLIACYVAVRDSTEQVIGELARLARDHQRRGSAHYYEVRNTRFNPQRAALASAVNGAGLAYTPALAAMFIYLNRTGYNGLFRLNAGGEFNVPAGRYANPRILDDANVRRVASILGHASVDLECEPFHRAVEGARAGDFVYFDPPYAPLSGTSRFTSYTAEGFGMSEQERLRDVIVRLANRGCYILVSNSTAPEIVQLYSTSTVKAAGITCHRVAARRAINSKASLRGPIDEFVITNIRPTS